MEPAQNFVGQEVQNEVNKQNPPEVHKLSKLRIVLIFVGFLIVSFFSSPLYFAPPDGLFVKFLSAIDPTFKDSGLAGGAILGVMALFSIPVFALIYSVLFIFSLNLIKSAITARKFLGIVFIVVILILIGLPVGLLLIKNQQDKTREQNDIKSIGFKVYNTTLANPLGNKYRSYELTCTGIHYTFYSSLTIVGLDEGKYNPDSEDTSCIELSSVEYTKAKLSADTGTPFKLFQFDNDKYSYSKKVLDETIYLIRFKGDQEYSFDHLLGLKAETLIKVGGGTLDCLADSNCETGYIDFYKSLK